MSDDAVETARDTARDYVERGKKQAGDMYATAREYEGELEDRVSENPLFAVLVAFGLGCLVGLMIRRG